MEQLALIKHRRDHVAIMRKSLGLIKKILDGEKTIESRWYFQKISPWDEITAGDTIYFKNASGPVEIRAKVAKVKQSANLNPLKIRQLFDLHKRQFGLGENTEEFFADVKNKRFGILIFLSDAEKIKPFNINKHGFGAMSAWLTLENIDKIKKARKETFKQNKLLR